MPCPSVDPKGLWFWTGLKFDMGKIWVKKQNDIISEISMLVYVFKIFLDLYYVYHFGPTEGPGIRI